jgi:HEAT repeat protein
MDNSLTLARHFARLVWLLIHEGQSTDEQKVALRAVVQVSKEASVRLGIKEGRLAVNNLVMPQALTGVQELAARLVAHDVAEIEIDERAAASELLSLARLLAMTSASTSDVAAFRQQLAQQEGRTIHVRMVAEEAAPAAEPVVLPEVDIPVAGGERVRALFQKLAVTADPIAAINVLEEIAFAAEQAAREGRPGDTAEVFAALITREPQVSDPELRRAFVVTMRRLTRPTLLRPIAHLLVTEAERRPQVTRVLQRCGQDGVDAIIDQLAIAGTAADRAMFRETLFAMTGAVEALVQTLSDPRWYIVRMAAELLGDMESQAAERPLADALRHADARVRRAVTRALGRIDSGFTVDALSRSLDDESPAVRLEAVAALSHRRSPRAGVALAQAIDNELDPEVQFAILAGLGKVGSVEAVQKLASASEAAGGLFKTRKNVALRVAAVYALAEARTPAALQALQALQQDKEKDVRDAVARLLLGSRAGAA